MTSKPANELYSREDLDLVQDLLQYKFTTQEGLSILAESLTQNAYETHEYAGDVILQYLITCWQLGNSKNKQPGALTKERCLLVNKSACVAYMRSIDLDTVVKTVNLQPGNGLNTVLSDMFEALLYALYKDMGEDSGMGKLKDFFYMRFSSVMKQLLDGPEHNYITMVQEWTQGRYKKLPTYTQQKRTGLDHCPSFVFQISLPENKSFVGDAGRSVSKAKQLAAEKAWFSHCASK